MSKKIEFVLELTRAEAVALLLVQQSGFSGQTVVDDAIIDVGRALAKADPSLETEQYHLWESLGHPAVELVRRVDETE